MISFRHVAEAWIASKHHGSGSIGRISFWVEQFSDTPIGEITEEQVDNAVLALIRRGKLYGGIGPKAGLPTGTPLSGSTINRFISTLAGIFKFARAIRVLPRSHTPPTRGIEKAPEPVDPDKYFRPEDVDKLIKIARVLDRNWKRLPALIIMGFHTGLRIGNLKQLRWRDIDFEMRTATVKVTKNGHPHVSPLTDDCITELRKLRRGSDNELVFRSDRNPSAPFCHDRLLKKVCDEANLSGSTFHYLRHGCGSALANKGISQAQIMAVMGHRTLAASARYMHNNVNDRRQIVEQVFS